MKKALLLLYLSAPAWISIFVGTLFSFRLIDTLMLAIISEATAIFSLTLSYKLPFELFRKVIHISGIIIILYSLHIGIDRSILLSIIGVVFLLSVPIYLLPKKFPNLIKNLAVKSVRYRENSIRCITHFLFAVFLMLLFMPYNFIFLGLIIAMFGDPIAFLVGHHHGRIKLLREKTLEGSVAFVAVVYVVLLLITQDVFISVLGAISGSVIEHVTGKYIDDNASVPFATGLLLMII